MIQNGKIESFTHYSKFSTLKDFNQHMYLWLNNNPGTFTKSEGLALYRLTRYAAKVLGVANVRIGTVLKVIHDEYGQHGISRSTFKRMLKKAKQIQLIKTIELTRKNKKPSLQLDHPTAKN